ncbi:MAG: GNAT family N-acetyltransferase [Acidimicrobiales bacterium]
MDFLSERLGEGFDLGSFDSGVPDLDNWLRRSARDSDGRNLTRTWVWHSGDLRVVGYYSLAPYFIERETLTRSQGRGLPERIPSYLLARLALDRSLRGQGLGSQLLASALLRVAGGASELGGRFVVVDAIDEDAASFYRHHGFTDIPGVAGRLVLPTKNISVV